VTFQSKCPQDGWIRPVAKYRNEDCLYLNVYQPHTTTTSTPVIVWFHGGGYVYGSSQDIDGSVLAKRAEAVVVTVNYRLGVFGFLSLPQLDAESPTRTSGNYAILDQQAALRWVQANIARFGGDPTNVTLMGQSAGGSSIWIHLASPANQALFSRAIVLSSPPARQTTKTEEQERGASSKSSWISTVALKRMCSNASGLALPRASTKQVVGCEPAKQDGLRGRRSC